MRCRVDSVEVDPGYFGNLQAQPKAQGDPIAKGFAQGSLASRQGLMPRPNSLAPGNLAPVASIVLDDFVGGQFHGSIKIRC